jgi:hypothetical protein
MGPSYGSSLSPAPPGGESSTGVAPTGVGGGTQGRLPTPTPPLQPPSSQMGVGGTSPAPPRSAQMPGTSGGSSPQRGFLQAQPGSGVGGGSGPLTQRAFNSSGRPYGGGSGGGGGYDVRGMIADARSSLMGKVGGMFGGESAAAPAGGSYQFPTADAVKPRMRGMARGMDPEQAGAVLARPSLMLPKLSRGVDPNSPFYDTMESLPASQIALLTTSGRKATTTRRWCGASPTLRRTPPSVS